MNSPPLDGEGLGWGEVELLVYWSKLNAARVFVCKKPTPVSGLYPDP